MFFACVILILTPLSVYSKGDVREITEETWADMLVGEWMVEFYAPWCPACRMLESTWKEFATWSEDLGIEVAAVDITANPALSGRFAITALPTIFHVKDGVFRQYRNPKRKEDFISFIEESKWNEVEPVPNWKSPQSIQMSFVAYFFKLSMVIRVTHNSLVEYGIPYWASYIIFGLGTIVIGTILGLLVVCCIDFISPVKRRNESQLQQSVYSEDDIIKEEKKTLLEEMELEKLDQDEVEMENKYGIEVEAKPGGVFPVNTDSDSDTEIEDQDEIKAEMKTKEEKLKEEFEEDSLRKRKN